MAEVITMPSAADRERRVAMAVVARRRLESAAAPRRVRGRAWINGREVGGPDPRYAHLGRTHD